ncbi:unnamed protein product [Dibothriocephalus latus]|uniref:BPTI/Kunitz inhibitor domain-containing protein n=1 Tax=Dibothriocephalus latus TaxID=60516 RepID=A0A3P6UAG8_DIBLA|nr:unnamed protein product [Dibothriocephalus latus]
MFLGCGGSENQFTSLQQCHDACEVPSVIQKIRQNAVDLCRLPHTVPSQTPSAVCVDVGQRVSRWFFDESAGRCQEFGYNHCSGTANNFLTRSDCEQFCGGSPLSNDALCQLPPEAGDCQDAHTLWFHNATGCHQFVYSGCGGNENRFSSRMDCLRTCRQGELIDNELPKPWQDMENSSLPAENNVTRENPSAPAETTTEAATTTPAPPSTTPTPILETFTTHPPMVYNLNGFTPKSVGDRRCDNDPKRTGCYTLPLPSAGGGRTPARVLFFFSVTSGTCKAFYLKADDRNCNASAYFTDGQECMHSCHKSSPSEQDLPNRCFARKLSGLTKCSVEHHNQSRWSYLPELHQCVLFSECHTQDAALSSWGNNFKTKSLCEATCLPKTLKDVCRLPKDTGPCVGTHIRYFYDPVEQKCQLFIYGGCLGNGNRFTTKAECEDACGSLKMRYVEEGARQTTTGPQTKPSGDSNTPPVPAEVFEQMRRITSMYSERYPFYADRHVSLGNTFSPEQPTWAKQQLGLLEV